MNDPLSVASLYFFLKNPEKYVTTRKQGTGDCLVKLGLNSACVQKCTWSGYQKYLEIISDLHAYLIPYHPDATFLDAQSFLWMLWMIKPDTPEYHETALDDKRDMPEKNDVKMTVDEDNSDPFESTVITETFKEGKKVEIYTTKYERDSRVRRQFLATQIKPYKCEVCGMDFESVYGELGKDVIEVHHKKPLSINDNEQEIKPNGEYLACLCANCHRMIHRKQGSIMTIEELRKLMDEQRAGTLNVIVDQLTVNFHMDDISLFVEENTEAEIIDEEREIR